MAQYYVEADESTTDAKLLSAWISSSENNLDDKMGKYNRFLNMMKGYYNADHPVYQIIDAMQRLIANPYTPICVCESMEDTTVALYGNELPDSIPINWIPVIPTTL